MCWPAPISEAPAPRVHKGGWGLGMALRLPGLLPASSNLIRGGLHHPNLPQPGKPAIGGLRDLATRLVFCDNNGGFKEGECGGKAGPAWSTEAEICRLQPEKDASTKPVQYVRKNVFISRFYM